MAWDRPDYVSIPYLSGHPFLLAKAISYAERNNCVNPLSIGTPISTSVLICITFGLSCVNPLSIGTPISTEGTAKEISEQIKCVNPLSIGTPISTHRFDGGRWWNYVSVSIPYLSGHPFLQTYQFESRKIGNVVSIPYLSGHPFLRLKRCSLKGKAGDVSIPYLSGHPFLPSSLSFPVTSQSRNVSIPYLSGHPFLQTLFSERSLLVGYCVNPLSIGTPISTAAATWEPYLTDACQSPIYRDTHFYYFKKNNKLDYSLVSIPYLSGHPFLQTLFSERSLLVGYCVNPLSIGTPISTNRLRSVTKGD